jgi:hypothetical protein
MHSSSTHEEGGVGDLVLENFIDLQMGRQGVVVVVVVVVVYTYSEGE